MYVIKLGFHRSGHIIIPYVFCIPVCKPYVIYVISISDLGDAWWII